MKDAWLVFEKHRQLHEELATQLSVDLSQCRGCESFCAGKYDQALAKFILAIVSVILIQQTCENMKQDPVMTRANLLGLARHSDSSACIESRA